MRVVNQQVPTPFRDIDRDTLMRPNALEFAQSAALLPLRMLGLARTFVSQARSASLIDLAVGHRRGAPVRPLRRQRHPGVPGRGPLRPRPGQRLPPARERALPHRHRPRHLRAHRAGRRGLGRRPDLAGRGGVHGAADGLQARRGQGPPPRRRRPALHDQRRHRGRGGRQVRDRRQPARPVRERLPEGHPDDARQPRPAGPRHGLPAHRLPGLQADRPPAPARGGGALEGALPGRRHHPDRARPERRADVRDEHPQLHAPDRDRPPRVRVRDAQARVRLRRDARRSAPATGSRSRPPACARWCASSPSSARSRPAGGGSSSRRRGRCCARRTRREVRPLLRVGRGRPREGSRAPGRARSLHARGDGAAASF